MTWRYLFGAALLAAAAVVVPAGRLSFGLHAVVGISSLVAIGVGIRRNAPARAAPWYAIGAAACAWVLGDLVFFGRMQAGVLLPEWLANALYAAAFPAMITGLLLLIRSRGPVRRLEGLLDSALYTVSVALVSVVFLVLPSWEASAAGPPMDRLLAVAYPMADIVVFALCVRLTTVCGPRVTAARFVVASVAFLTVSDAWLQLARVGVGIADVHLLQLGWLLGYALLGATALHPSMRTLSDVDLEHEPSYRGGQVARLAFATLLGPAVILVQIAAGVPTTPGPVLASTPVVVGLVARRMALMLRRLSEQAERLALVAETDYVTGLPNRRRFAEDITALLETPSPRGALLLVGVDHLTEIVEAIGHATGDEVLKVTGRRLREAAGPSAVVARTNEATYGVLDPDAGSPVAAQILAADLRTTLERSHGPEDAGLSLDTSVGVVLVTKEAPQGAAAAFRRAEAALRAARDRPERIALYTAEMDADEPTGSVVRDVRAALDSGEIVLHYQPQIEVATGRVPGVEALARWQHPERGLLPPAAFIPAVEGSDLIGPFTRHVLDSALAQCARWRSEGLFLTVAVNLSVRNLLDPQLVEEVARALVRHGLDPSALELEITETSAMVDPRRSLEAVGALSRLGVALSIDDYGTGYSSLAYLQRLPVGRLKMDRSFVSGICTDAASAAIVRSTIELARNLALDVVAEGVEDDETWGRLRDMGCWGAQGFGICRPVPAGEIVARVAAVEERFGAMASDRRVVVPVQPPQLEAATAAAGRTHRGPPGQGAVRASSARSARGDSGQTGLGV